MESFGCDNRGKLLAVKDKYDEDVDVKGGLSQEGNEEDTLGEITALFGDSVFHNGVAMEDNSL